MNCESAIPRFDLSAKPEVDEILSACRSVGCFNVIGGGIDADLTQKLLARMADFFDLPDGDPIKRAVHRDQNADANGWTPMLEEPAYEPGTVAWVESFDCVLSRDRLNGLPDEIRRQTRPSIWPRLPGFRDTVRGHWDLLIRVANRIFPLVSTMLKQSDDFLSARASSQALNTLRLLNYPKRCGQADDVSKGISAHTDFECITLIHQTAPGLEIQTPAGDWVQVSVEPGNWTVLLGDMVERWSNGTLKATPHRVPTTSWPRRSIVMFMAADPGIDIQPLDAFVNENNPSRFEGVTQDGLIDVAMARAEANRKEMRSEVERLRTEIS